MPDTDTNSSGSAAIEPLGSLRFRVVGVGASAGGLAATSELLRHLGPQPGLALVIIHHLEPSHASSLVEIFARVTQLKIVTARAGMPFEANCAYVSPPNAGVIIDNGVLQLTPRVHSEGGLHLPIDSFFTSLAAELKADAVGVLLSGTGADGTSGIAAIKRAGGMTFVQDASAEFRGMPESALATGFVDHVLPPAQIAQRLRELADAPASAEDDGPALQNILMRVRMATGVDFTSYKESMVRRRIQGRALAHGQLGLREYAALLDGDTVEATALCAELLIHVTSFFRDPAVFEALKSSVYPKLLLEQPRESGIRIWVPGCSSGEEVYSIAISLLEYLAEHNAHSVSVSLFGTDVSLDSIAKARAGRFDKSIENDVSAARLQRYFYELGDGYQIRSEVRDRCVFAKHDATRDPPFSSLDLVSCRNLMIYLNTALQERLLPIFHYALRENGFLVLGASETTREYPGFVAFDAKHKIFGRTATAPRLLFDFKHAHLPLPSAGDGLPLLKPWGSADVHREADRLVLAEFAPPGVVISDDLSIMQFRGKTGPFLEPLPGVASFDLLRMVREELRLPLRQLIDEARASRSTARKAGLRLSLGVGAPMIELEVIPFGATQAAQQFFVVLFKELSLPAKPEAAQAEDAPQDAPQTAQQTAQHEQLAQELTSTRAYLQAVVEQFGSSNEELRTLNEEVVSSNEELRSTNEELQMAKEEVQATNEELRTLNEDINVRNLETNRLNDDMSNILSSVEIPIVIVGRDLHVRRFTPAAARLLQLAPSDLGRALTDIKISLGMPDLVQVITDVFEQVLSVNRSVRDREGRMYQLAVRPYFTADKRVDGTVISIFDVDDTTRGASLLAQAYAETVIDTVEESLVLVDQDLRVLSANRAFQRTFELALATEALEGKSLFELGDAALAVLATPDLRAQLQALRPGDKLAGLRVEAVHSPYASPNRTFMLNARRIDQRNTILLALRDITKQQDAERQIRLYQARLQRMSFEAAVSEERERRRIAADLHDGIGQALALAQIKLTGMRDALDTVTAAPKTQTQRADLDEVIELLAKSVLDTRTLTFELSPPMLYDLGLKDALSWLAEDVEKRQGVHIHLSDDGAPKPLDESTAALVYRAVRELLMNIFKHAKASSAEVSLRRKGDNVEIDVVDAGVGFVDSEVTLHSPGRGFGLFNVREQISRLGGSMNVVSAPGEGTRVSLSVPLQQPV